jgi:hypothetical protein
MKGITLPTINPFCIEDINEMPVGLRNNEYFLNKMNDICFEYTDRTVYDIYWMIFKDIVKFYSIEPDNIGFYYYSEYKALWIHSKTINDLYFLLQQQKWISKHIKSMIHIKAQRIIEIEKNPVDVILPELNVSEDTIETYTCENIIKSLCSFINKYIDDYSTVISIFSIITCKLQDIDFINKLNKQHGLLPINDNRVLDLKILNVRKRKKEDYFTYEVHAKYKPYLRLDEHPEMYNFLRAISINKQDRYEYFQQIFGSVLISTDVLICLMGDGNNGKSFIKSLIMHVLGGEIISIGYDLKFKKSSTELPDLKSVHVCIDICPKLPVEKVYYKYYKLIPFDCTFYDEDEPIEHKEYDIPKDYTFTDRILTDDVAMSVFLNWLIQGAHKVLNNSMRFITPPEILEFQKKFKGNLSPIIIRN